MVDEYGHVWGGSDGWEPTDDICIVCGVSPHDYRAGLPCAGKIQPVGDPETIARLEAEYPGRHKAPAPASTLTVTANMVGVCRACRIHGPVVYAETPEGRYMLTLSLCVECSAAIGRAAFELRRLMAEAALAAWNPL